MFLFHYLNLRVTKSRTVDEIESDVHHGFVELYQLFFCVNNRTYDGGSFERIGQCRVLDNMRKV